MKQKIFFLLFVIVCCLTQWTQAQPNQHVAMQWHFDGNCIVGEEDPVDCVDWIYGIIETPRKQFIVCGFAQVGTNYPDRKPVIMKLDNLGRMVWSKIVTSAAGLTGSGLSSSGAGNLYQVIKTPNGYAAVGFYGIGSGSASLIVEVDEDGNFLNSTPLLTQPQQSSPWANISSSATTITMDPNNAYYLIGGSANLINGGNSYGAAMIAKIDYSTLAVSAAYFAGGQYGTASKGGNNFWKILAKPTTGGNYNVYACGYQSMSGDNVDVTGNNKDNSPVTLHTRNKDIWVLSINQSLSSINFDETFDKTDLSSVYYTEYGAVTARGLSSHSGTPGYWSPVATSYLEESVNEDERAVDMVLTQDGKLSVLAMINRIAIHGDYDQANGSNVIEDHYNSSTNTNEGGVTDHTHGRTEWYDEYVDGDVYILKIDPSNGSKTWDKNVSHFSSIDFIPRFTQNNRGNYIIAGSTTDYYSSAGSDLHTVDEYDMLLVETEDNSTAGHIWRRNIHAKEESGMCVFGMCNTSDGGFAVVGDNDNMNDNFSISKFAPPCEYAALGTYTINATDDGVHTLTGNETINSPTTINGQIKVPSGKTLTINGCTVGITTSDHLYDYFQFHPSINTGVTQGILVEPGGHVVLNGATVKGFNDCSSDYMWEGIVIQGDPAQASLSTYQGTLAMTGATVSDARIGVQVSDAKRVYLDEQRDANPSGVVINTHTYSSRYQNNISHGGGIVQAETSTFHNCRFSVNHQLYTQGTCNGSYEGCTFECTGPMADPCFYVDINGNGLPSDDFFAAWAVSGLSFLDNTFTCDASFNYKLRPKGIALIDAGATISASCATSGPGGCSAFNSPGNQFANLSYGVCASYSATVGGKSPTIQYNSFDNNNVGVMLNNAQAAKVLHNSFGIPDNNVYQDANSKSIIFPAGISMAGCHSYGVHDNSFDHCNGCSGTGASTIGVQMNNGHKDDEMVNLNNFDHLNSATLSFSTNGGTNGGGDPIGLQWHCNDYQADNNYDIEQNAAMFFRGSSLTGPAGYIRPRQGECRDDGSPAGNRFYNYSSYGHLNHLQVSQSVTYNYNLGNTDYDPTFNGTPGYVSAIYTTHDCMANNTGHNFACPATDGTTGYDPSAMPGIRGRLTSMRTDKNNTDPGDEAYPGINTGEHLAVNEMVRYYTEQGYYDSAAALLVEEGRYAEGIFFYIAAGMWTEADDTHGLLPTGTTEEQNFAWLTGKSIGLFSNGDTWYDLDSAARDTLVSMISGDSYVGYMAENINALLNGKGFNQPSPDVDTTTLDTSTYKQQPIPRSTAFGSKNFGNSKGADILAGFSAYPNPNNGNFILSSTEAGWLNVYSVDGRLVKRYAIEKGKTNVRLPEAITPGVYIGKFSSNAGNKTHIIRLVYKE